MKRFVFSVVAASLIGSVGSAVAQEDAAGEVAAVAGKLLNAQRTFDLPAIRALTAENYVEISPAGELDVREKMLTFYAPEKKKEAPTTTVENELTRVYGDVGIQTVKLTYTMMAGGQPRTMSLRATLVAHKQDGKWKVVSAQYTGVRLAPAVSPVPPVPPVAPVPPVPPAR